MLFRGEMSERISVARTVTEGKDLFTLPETGGPLAVDEVSLRQYPTPSLIINRAPSCHSEERSEEESLIP